jgi:hypothetical protein
MGINHVFQEVVMHRSHGARPWHCATIDIVFHELLFPEPAASFSKESRKAGKEDQCPFPAFLGSFYPSFFRYFSLIPTRNSET